jgi:hypothetical protein
MAELHLPAPFCHGPSGCHSFLPWSLGDSVHFNIHLTAYKQVLLFVCFLRYSHDVTQAGLELKILLPQPLEYWNYRCTPGLGPIFIFFSF